MAGTITLSLQPQFDVHGHPLSGGKIKFVQAGTTSTPQNAYKDLALTLPHPNPITLAEDGRVPQVYFADGYIKIVLIDAHGTEFLDSDFVPVIGASSGGGSSPSVDATSIMATGDVKYRYGTGALAGFVRMNSRTIGSATSGATERANADCQALFLYLHATDTNLTVSGGRGASAAADWAANKTITLPDGRARMLAGLADMGNSNSGALAANTFVAGNATTLGSALGAARTTLQTANLPAYTPSGSLSLSTDVSTSVSTSVTTTVSTSVTTSITDPGHTHNIQEPMQGNNTGALVPSRIRFGDNGAAQTTLNVATDTTGTGITASSTATSTASSPATSTATSTATPTGSFTGVAQGGSSTAFDIFSPALLITIYIKL